MEKTVMIIIAVVSFLIIIGVIVALKNKSSTKETDTGPQAHVDSAADSAKKAADISAAAASAAANALTPREAAAATQQAVAAGAVAQQAAVSSAHTAQQASSGAPVPDVDCVLSDWGDYGKCISDIDRKLFTTRLRTIKVQPSGKGKACESLVDKTPCDFKDGVFVSGPCKGVGIDTHASTEHPISVECRQMLWHKDCKLPFVESDWPPNYWSLPTTTLGSIANDIKLRLKDPELAFHCNKPMGDSYVRVMPSCKGYESGSAEKPIPLQCHQDIWKRYCEKPLVESDWPPNYRTLPTTTLDWLTADAELRSKSEKWKSRCN